MASAHSCTLKFLSHSKMVGHDKFLIFFENWLKHIQYRKNDKRELGTKWTILKVDGPAKVDSPFKSGRS